MKKSTHERLKKIADKRQQTILVVLDALIK